MAIDWSSRRRVRFGEGEGQQWRTDGEHEVERADVVGVGGRPREQHVRGILRTDRRGRQGARRVRRAQSGHGQRGARQRAARVAGGHTHDVH